MNVRSIGRNSGSLILLELSTVSDIGPEEILKREVFDAV